MPFFEPPNPTEFESRENAEILVNSIESGLFGHSNLLNSAVSKMATWNFVHIFINKYSLTNIPFLTKMLDFFENTKKWWSFSQFSKIKKRKIWNIRLIAMFNLQQKIKLCGNQMHSFVGIAFKSVNWTDEWQVAGTQMCPLSKKELRSALRILLVIINGMHLSLRYSYLLFDSAYP